MEKKFLFQWILFSSIASIAIVITWVFWPLVGLVCVTVVQSILLAKYKGSRSYYWMLTPLLLLASIIALNKIWWLCILATIFSLELVFYVVIGKFSKMIWTLVTGLSLSLIGLLQFMDTSNDFVLITMIVVIIPSLIWTLQGLYIGTQLDFNNVTEKMDLNDIIDAP